MSSFQDDLYQLVQEVKEKIDPFSSGEEESGKDIQLIVKFASKWDLKDQYDAAMKDREILTQKIVKEKTEVTETTSLTLIKELIPAIDDAYLIKNFTTDANVIRGMDSMIHNMEKLLLTRNGAILKPKAGDKFDPNTQTAITAENIKTLPGQPLSSGTYVYKTLRNGYSVMGRVIRAAEVHVMILS